MRHLTRAMRPMGMRRSEYARAEAICQPVGSHGSRGMRWGQLLSLYEVEAGCPDDVCVVCRAEWVDVKLTVYEVGPVATGRFTALNPNLQNLPRTK